MSIKVKVMGGTDMALVSMLNQLLVAVKGARPAALMCRRRPGGTVQQVELCFVDGEGVEEAVEVVIQGAFKGMAATNKGGKPPESEPAAAVSIDSAEKAP